MPLERFRVTAAIPAYNEATRIATAIASVRAQTEPPAEILVVDDGSTDATTQIATALGARVVTQPNAGIARTRNRLLAEARSPWIAFLDADDVWYPNKLGEIRRAHEAWPQADFIFSDLRCRRESGEIATTSVFETTPQYLRMAETRRAGEARLIEGAELGRALAVGNFIGTSTVVARRDRILARGVTFAEDLPIAHDVFVAEDVEWYLRVLRATDAVAVENLLGEYRWREASLASNYGRMRYGDVKLGERVLAHPETYVAGVGDAFVAARRDQLRHVARLYVRARDFARSQAILREAQRHRAGPIETVAIALLEIAKSPPGRALVDGLERLWDTTRRARTPRA